MWTKAVGDRHVRMCGRWHGILQIAPTSHRRPLQNQRLDRRTNGPKWYHTEPGPSWDKTGRRIERGHERSASEWIENKHLKKGRPDQFIIFQISFYNFPDYFNSRSVSPPFWGLRHHFATCQLRPQSTTDPSKYTKDRYLLVRGKWMLLVTLFQWAISVSFRLGEIEFVLCSLVPTFACCFEFCFVLLCLEICCKSWHIQKATGRKNTIVDSKP